MGADLLDFKSKKYLVVSDSTYNELVQLTSESSAAVIGQLKSIYARWGIPEELDTENQACFASAEFREFAAHYGFDQALVSARYTQANGAAERAVATAKSILSQTDPLMALVLYRNTSHPATGFSPAQLMIGRQLRPTLVSNLRSIVPDDQAVRQRDAITKAAYAH